MSNILTDKVPPVDTGIPVIPGFTPSLASGNVPDVKVSYWLMACLMAAYFPELPKITAELKRVADGFNAAKGPVS